MSKPKLLDAYTKESKTITAIKSDYAIVSRWTDDNPEGEDRVGYFVSNDQGDEISISKSTSTSKVFGVTVDAPGFATNVKAEFCDVCGLHPEYSYVCFSGFAKVIDNGLCEVGSICKSSDDGTAVPSTTGGGYRVITRIDEEHVLIHIDPLLQVDVEGTRLRVTY